jgi:hypothetical protein
MRLDKIYKKAQLAFLRFFSIVRYFSMLRREGKPFHSSVSSFKSPLTEQKIETQEEIG